MRLTPTARRLERLLAEFTDRQLDEVTNEVLAAELGVSPRSVTTALSRLTAAGRIVIHSRRGHPLTDPTARSLRVVREGGDRR